MQHTRVIVGAALVLLAYALLAAWPALRELVGIGGAPAPSLPVVAASNQPLPSAKPTPRPVRRTGAAPQATSGGSTGGGAGGSAPVSGTAIPPTAGSPAASGSTLSTGSPGAGPRPPLPRRGRYASPRATDLTALSSFQPWGPFDQARVRYAAHDAELRKSPGGTRLIPVSLNRAPLTVLRGTRLLPMEERGEWVMVRSPSSTIGWVEKTALSDTRPFTPDA